MTAHHTSPLFVDEETVGDSTLLTVVGELDSSTYRDLRDRIITAALDEPAAVLIDVSDLAAAAESAWVVFASARWHVTRWPKVPLVLICGAPSVRSEIRRNGVTRHVPVVPTLDDALTAIDPDRLLRERRQVRAELPAEPSSLDCARAMVEQWFGVWSREDLIPVAKIVVTAFVENVLRHTECEPEVRLEPGGDTVTVAVADASRAPATVREHSGGARLSGLKIVDALSRMWGVAPTSNGKTVWAMISPENRL